jgi:nucleotide-binding universal stress UspA family protein
MLLYKKRGNAGKHAMYNKILAAINEHFNSEVAARHALHLSKACGAKFYTCFIAEKAATRASFDKAEAAMKRLFILAEKIGVSVESITETGDPVAEIRKIAAHESIDLVFASTRREDMERRFFTGTVARSLSLKLPCSVALVRVVHTGKIHPSNVLVPVKMRIARIKEWAYFTSKMATAFNARVHVFHVTKPITRFLHGEIHLTPVEWEKRIPSDIADFLDRLKKNGVAFESRLTPGVIGRSITIEAAVRRHDLIIMGASERSLFSSLFTRRNPVENVLRETPCNLIVLKPRHEDK